MELPANDPSVANTSNTPTLAGSAAPSRVTSAKKASRPPSRSDSIRLSADDDSVVVPVKDRAPPFVVALCLFQSLAGLLFGFVSFPCPRLDCLSIVTFSIRSNR
jgi:SP family sugar:H+ symporter-like MFS transporter